MPTYRPYLTEKTLEFWYSVVQPYPPGPKARKTQSLPKHVYCDTPKGRPE